MKYLLSCGYGPVFVFCVNPLLLGLLDVRGGSCNDREEGWCYFWVGKSGGKPSDCCKDGQWMRPFFLSHPTRFLKWLIVLIDNTYHYSGIDPYAGICSLT